MLVEMTSQVLDSTGQLQLKAEGGFVSTTNNKQNWAVKSLVEEELQLWLE